MRAEDTTEERNFPLGMNHHSDNTFARDKKRTDSGKEAAKDESREWKQAHQAQGDTVQRRRVCRCGAEGQCRPYTCGRFIREVALDKTLSAALSIEESERMKRISDISYKMQVNLNQLAKLANSCGLPFVIDAIREYIVRINEYFRTGVWREMDLRAYEAEQKQRDNLADKVRDLQERNDNLMRVSSTYYFYTADGERMFCERYKCRMYPDKMGIYWYFKVSDNPSYCLPQEISWAYHRREISIRDVYLHWKENPK